MVATIDASALERHRRALTGHCYRMLGCNAEADDAVQETMLRAYRALDRFDGRSALHTWLYRIATNVCLDALGEQKRRALPLEEGGAGTVDDELLTRDRTHWLEPVADARVLPEEAGPEERLALRQSIRLAFVTALQHLPPRQRAALLLTDVLGFSAAEVADCLETSTTSVHSALQRARATLAEREAGREQAPLSDTQADLVEQFARAFERYDVDAIARMLTSDAITNMPPYTLWLRGPADASAWMLGRGAACRGSRLLRVEANGVPALAQYRPRPGGGHHAWALILLELGADRIRTSTYFLDVERIFPAFGLPLDLG